MALIKTIDDPQAPGTIDAYAKYANFSINTFEMSVVLTLAIYRSQAARDAADAAGRPVYAPIRTETYRTIPDGSYGPDGNRIAVPGAPTFADFAAGDNTNPQGTGAQIYGFLKAFTAWAGAEDA